jgi:hypothetical protein
MFEQSFKNIDDILHKEAGCTTELDYTEQSSWLLFLKYLDSLETDKATEAVLEGKSYSYILDVPYRWETWAAPKDKSGQLDHNKALTGDDLVDFVDRKLFPYLHGFTQRATGPATIEYKIGEMLVAMTEQATGLLGSPLMVPESDKFLPNQRLGLVAVKPGVPWINEFFFHVFNTQAVRQAIHTSASGVKVRHTSPTKIGEVVVSFPTSIKEQKAIVAVLADLHEET